MEVRGLVIYIHTLDGCVGNTIIYIRVYIYTHRLRWEVGNTAAALLALSGKTRPKPHPKLFLNPPQYCDLGSLRRVLLRGAFHRRIGGGNAGSLAVDLPGLLYVALEVAEAVAYLHSIRLCHCDVKVRAS